MKHQSSTSSPFNQPKAVWAVAFACVISFMGIGLVDPILPPSGRAARDAQPGDAAVHQLPARHRGDDADHGLGVEPHRRQAHPDRRLALIVVFAAFAGTAGSIGGIIGFRAGWGLGNALFIATSLAVIVASASGGFAGAIILYETALGVGIAHRPAARRSARRHQLARPVLRRRRPDGRRTDRDIVLLPAPPNPAARAASANRSRHCGTAASRPRALAACSTTGLLHDARLHAVPRCTSTSARLGGVFFGWGVLVAIFAVFGAPWLKARFGTPRSLYGNFILLAADLAVIAIWPHNVALVITAVIVAGAFLGVNNTLVTTAVMSIAPVERPVAAATYGFVRFIGGGLAPFVAAKLAEHINVRLPFLIGAGTILLAAVVLSTVHGALDAADRGEMAQPELDEIDRFEREEAVHVGAGLGNVE